VKVTPVIDILNGLAVHAVRGNRNDYKPLESMLCNSANPVAVARAFKSKGFSNLYIADLDSILGKGENLATVKKIAEETGLELLVDAGISDLRQAKRLLQNGVERVIVGTETLSSLSNLSGMLRSLGDDKVVVSLDLKNGKVLSNSTSIASMDATKLAHKLEEMGVRELIILDLDLVGSREGVDLALISRLVQDLKINVDVGGGVRDLDDLLTLQSIGVSKVLVATALHTGKIRVEELYSAGLL